MIGKATKLCDHHKLSPLFMNYLRMYKGNMKKKVQNQIRPDSNIIVDPSDFRRKGLINMLVNKFKNSNTLGDAKRNFDDFNPKDFSQQALQHYKIFIRLYKSQNYRDIFSYLGEGYFKEFKNSVKNKKNKNLDQLLGWRILQNPVKVQIVQARTHAIKFNQMKAGQTWYQLTCRYQDKKGQNIYNILERHQKGANWKYIKFDI